MIPADSTPLILVVDDESSIRASLSDVLTDEKFEVVTADDGSDALDKASVFQPDLVFLDIWMPGWDGIETLEKLKKLLPDTEVIMISGHATISNALEATKRGAFDFIEKPLDIDSILLSAKRALEKRLANKGKDSNSSSELLKSEQESVRPSLTHSGVCSKGLAGRNLGQRTLKSSAVLYGKGLHSGQKSGLVLEPLPENSGLHFARIGGGAETVPALIENIESTNFATRLSNRSHQVATIEHLMSALHAYGISNLLIKCNGEVPILDGSAAEFCKLIDRVGIKEQGGEWYEIAVDRTYEVFPNGEESLEKVSIHPADSFKVSYQLNYPEPVGEQFYEINFSENPESFVQEIAPARTFGFMKDIERLQKIGLAAGGTLDNFILIGEEAVVNTELRFDEELARHKILDIVGDLFLLGRPIRGHVVAEMSGHADNIELLRQFADRVFE